MSNIVVTVFATSTSGRAGVNINGGSTWKELQAAIADQTEISADGMRATIQSTKVTLEDNGAIIPNEDFTLFLTPLKVKSGQLVDC